MNYLKNNKFEFSKGIPTSLIIIGAIGLVLRLYNFPYDIPLVLDGFTYFLYATDVSILNNLANWSISSNGWPIFLSFFFTIFDSTNFLDYMNLQRIITVSISILTIIPVYFLCRKFFNKFYSILGVALFAFEPHIIINSSLGITESLFIILVTISIVLFLGSKTKSKFLAFVIIGLATTVRLESLFVFFAFVISYILQNRHEEKIIIKNIVGVGIFVLSLLPIILIRTKSYGEDFITSRVVQNTNYILTEAIPTNLENIVKLGGWSLIPYFIILVPIGIYLILRKRKQNTNTILIIMSFMFVPVAIAFSWVSDTRYIYPLFPLLCIVSIFPIIKFIEKFNHQKTLVIIIIAIILFSSILYLEIKKNDLNHQEEAYSLAQYVVNIADGVNEYHPEDGYISPSEISTKWPMLKSDINFEINIIKTEGFNSLEKYIESARVEGLSHLVVDNNKKRPNFLNDIYHHEEKYPFLVKVYDSKNNGFNYHVKIFEIDYKYFKNEQIIKNE